MAAADKSSSNPFKVLGVSESAKYEEIENAIKEAKERAAGNEELVREVEAAENQILFMRLKDRSKDAKKLNLERLGLGARGKPSLPPNIQLPAQLPKWSYIKESYRLRDMWDRTPDRKGMISTGTIFGILGAFSLLSPSSVASYLPLGFLCCVAFHYQKQKKWIRSIPLSLLSVTAGWFLGSLLPRIGFPIFGASPIAFAGLVTYVFMWLCCNFVR